MLRIHYIDVSSEQSLSDYVGYLNVLKEAIAANRILEPDIEQLCFTNASPYAEKLFLSGCMSTPAVLQQDKIQMLVQAQQDLNFSPRFGTYDRAYINIRSPYKEVELAKRIRALVHVRNDLSPLSNLYFMLHYASENYQGLIQFNYYDSIPNIEQLRVFFLQHRALISNRIKLILHTRYHNEIFRLCPRYEINGSGVLTDDCLATLSNFTSETIGLRTDAMTRLLSVNWRNSAIAAMLIDKQESSSDSESEYSLASSTAGCYSQDGADIIDGLAPVEASTATSQSVDKHPDSDDSVVWELMDAYSATSQACDEFTVNQSSINQLTDQPRVKRSRTMPNQPPSNTLFPISIADKEKLNQLAEARHFIYLHDSPSYIKKCDLVIAPVCVLSATEHNLGVFARQHIPEKLKIGVYSGEKIGLETIRDNAEYIFEVDRGKEWIDALKQRNWTAFVNSAAHASMANVGSIKLNKTIVYVTSKPIFPGEQLLMDYGQYYTFEDSTVMRFLKTSDSSLDSADIIEKYEDLYREPPEHLTANESDCLRVPFDLRFKIPNFKLLMPPNKIRGPKPRVPKLLCKLCSHPVDFNAQLLAVDSFNVPLPQAQQENITALMYACITNNKTLVAYLLEKRANPNIQSSIQGYTALHLVVKSELSGRNKHIIMDSLLDHGAIIDLRDRNKKSFLHVAIDGGHLDVVEWLYAYLMRTQGPNWKAYLENKVHAEELDPFVYSISRKQVKISIFFASYLNIDIMRAYLNDAKDRSAFKANLTNLIDNKDTADLLNALTSLIETHSNCSDAEKDTLLFKLLELRKRNSVLQMNPVFFAPAKKQVNAATKAEHFAFFRGILLNRKIDMKNKFQQLNLFIGSDRFQQMSVLNQKEVLKKTIKLYLDNARWLSLPYELKILTSDKFPDQFENQLIYLLPQGDSHRRFKFHCVDLENRCLDGELLISSKDRFNISFSLVLSLIARLGHDLSDQTRYNNAQLYLTQATHYYTQLTTEYAHEDSEIATQLSEVTQACAEILTPESSVSVEESLSLGRVTRQSAGNC